MARTHTQNNVLSQYDYYNTANRHAHARARAHTHTHTSIRSYYTCVHACMHAHTHTHTLEGIINFTMNKLKGYIFNYYNSLVLETVTSM